MDQEITVGIDLGTTQSLISYYDPDMGKPVSIAPDMCITYPSTVRFLKNSERVCIPYNELTYSGWVFCPKRLIGQEYKNENHYDAKTFGSPICGIREHERADVIPGYHVAENKEISATQISAMILKHMKEEAEKRLQKVLSRVVLTVPVNFSWSQRIETERAAELAGFQSVELQLEPVMAAYEYCHVNNQQNCTLLTYDFGGGTFDVCVVRCDDDGFSVLNSNGDQHLGGEDITMAIGKELEQHFTDALHHDWYNNKTEKEIAKIRLKIREFAEEKKRSARNDSDVVNVDMSHFCETWNLNFQFHLINSQVQEIVQQTIDMTHQLAQQYNIDKVLVIGGSGDFFLVREKLRKVFGDRLATDISPSCCVSWGAARYGHKREEQNVPFPLLTVHKSLSKGIGILSSDNEPRYIVQRNEPLPKDETRDLIMKERSDTILTQLIEEDEDGFRVIKNLTVPLGRMYDKGTMFSLRLIIKDLLVYYEVRHKDETLLTPLTMIRL